MLSSLLFKESPVEKINYRNTSFWLKRDDLIHPIFNGNKARKLKYFLDADLSAYTKIASYGGHQSNAMFSLAGLASIKGLDFEYYVKPLPETLKKNPIGNLKKSLELGMQLIELENYAEFFAARSEKSNVNSEKETLWIRQGGAEKEAEPGVKELAQEIEKFADNQGIKDLSVFLPSGTGTTALYLQKHLSFPVCTTACIGANTYLEHQFSLLEKNKACYPQILNTQKKYHFGKLYPEFLEVWRDFHEETNVEFELLYDPKMLLIFKEILQNRKGNFLYIHSGGTPGNESMLARYNYEKKSLTL